MTKFFISVAFGVMAVAIVVLLYAIGFLILRFIWRMLKRLLPDGIGSPIYVLVAFSLAAAVFTTTVSSVWTVVFYVIQFTLVNVPQFLLSGFGTTEDCDFSVPTENNEQADSPSKCISKAGAAFGSNFVAFVQNFFEQRPPGPSVVYVLAFLALAAMLMVLFNDRKADEQHAPPFFIRYLADASLEIRNRFAIGLILAAAVYLSLCAIAAVSLFKPSNISILGKEQFETKLNHSKLELNAADNAANSFKTRFPEISGPS